MRKKKLKWGQTPWDNMTKEELLKEVWKMFSALQSANVVLHQSRDANFFHKVIWRHKGGSVDHKDASEQIQKLVNEDLYWGNGVGGSAIAKVEQALSTADKFDSETVYRSFFRYADDLLFIRNQKHIGTGWAVCPKCGVMLGETTEGKSSVGEICDWGKNGNECGGIFRPLEWEDLNK